jgi:predicted DNA-binding transcriptional regulator AlpA
MIDIAETPSPRQLLTLKEVCALLRRSKASIYRDVAAGHFPKALKIGASSRWLESEIHAYIAGAARG